MAVVGMGAGDENHYARSACKRQSICVNHHRKVKRIVGAGSKENGGRSGRHCAIGVA